jgi:hypothetical protein
MTDAEPEEKAGTLARQFEARMEAGDVQGAAELEARLWCAAEPLESRRPRDIPLLGWERMAPADRDRFLFVSGTPRSGTSALGRLLKSHADVTVYNELYSDRHGYLPAMFVPENIRELHRRGRLPMLDRFNNLDVLHRTPTTRWVGDKRPNFMRSAALTLAHFRDRDVVVVHVVRDIRAIAESYRRRAEKGNWPASRDHTVAVAEANMNNRAVLSVAGALAPRHRLVVLDYDRFWVSPESLRRLLASIDLDPGRMLGTVIEERYAEARDLVARPALLTHQASSYVERHYDAEVDAAVRAMSMA